LRGLKHAKLHWPTLTHGRPTSLCAQNDSAPTVSQRKPEGHWAFEPQLWVHRLMPPGTMLRHIPESHALSIWQGVISGAVPGMPLELEVSVEVLGAPPLDGMPPVLLPPLAGAAPVAGGPPPLPSYSQRPIELQMWPFGQSFSASTQSFVHLLSRQ
jgi:hypothetical protein